MEVKLIQISNGNVIIVNGDSVYIDTYENYLLDDGSFDDVTLLVHDNQQNYCEVDGDILNYPQQKYVDEIERVDELIQNQQQRIYDAIPLEQRKAAKRAEINRIRDEKEIETLNNFDLDVKSAIRILFVRDKLSRKGGTIDWTMADNTEENVTSAEMNDLVDAVVDQSNNVHNIANYLKAQIEAATTAEEVEAIEWIDEIPDPEPQENV